MATQPGDKLKLETMINMETTSSGEFAVLVLVTAPLSVQKENSDSPGARGVDLVAVLDVSAGMNKENRLGRMKEATFSVLDNLGQDDRLCILAFNDEVRMLMDLSFMSDENRTTARAKVEELAAPAGGGANVKAATEAATKILAQRGEEEQRDRAGRVIFLSNGDEDDAAAGLGLQKQNDATNTSPELPPDAFVLGAGDKLSPLGFSAGNTAAAYSYVNEDVDNIKDAPGLTSVDTAMGVQIDLHAQDGVTIKSIESGGESNSVGPDGPRSLTIFIKDLYAGEQKSFTVNLTVPERKDDLLAVTGWYRDPESDEDIQLDVYEVTVPPPSVATPVLAAVNSQVPTEMDRIEEKKEAAQENKQDMPDAPEHKQAIADEKQDMQNVPNMQEAIQDENRDKKTARTTSSLVTTVASLLGTFAAVSNLLFWIWGSLEKQVDDLKKEEHNFAKVKTMWTWARNKLYPCALVLLLVGAAMLLMPKKAEDDGRSSSLSVPQQPGWPQIKESFDSVLHKEMENAGINSCFNTAWVTDRCPAMNRYIYQAIVHGGVVHVPLLEQMAQMHDVEKEELPAVIKTSTEETEEKMANGCYLQG